MLEFFLILSLVFNVIMGWYIGQLIKRFLNVSEDLDGFFDSLGEFSEHLEVINKMETYYGDTTLQNLVRHSGDVVQFSNEIRALYDVNYELREEEDEKTE